MCTLLPTLSYLHDALLCADECAQELRRRPPILRLETPGRPARRNGRRATRRGARVRQAAPRRARGGLGRRIRGGEIRPPLPHGQGQRGDALEPRAIPFRLLSRAAPRGALLSGGGSLPRAPQAQVRHQAASQAPAGPPSQAGTQAPTRPAAPARARAAGPRASHGVPSALPSIASLARRYLQAKQEEPPTQFLFQLSGERPPTTVHMSHWVAKTLRKYGVTAPP
eukprot:scaffold289769_cov22-Tisochrysis_lutea.AAC.1